MQDQRTARSHRRVVVHFYRLKRCPQDIRLGMPPAAVSRAHTLAANQPSGAGRVVPPGTNLQYFDDDEPEGEPDITKNQGLAVEIEQRPTDEDANVASRESVSQESFEMEPVLQNKNGDVADQRQAAASIDQTSWYPKRDRRPPAYYGGYRYSLLSKRGKVL